MNFPNLEELERAAENGRGRLFVFPSDMVSEGSWGYSVSRSPTDQASQRLEWLPFSSMLRPRPFAGRLEEMLARGPVFRDGWAWPDVTVVSYSEGASGVSEFLRLDAGEVRRLPPDLRRELAREDCLWPRIGRDALLRKVQSAVNRVACEEPCNTTE